MDTWPAQLPPRNAPTSRGVHSVRTMPMSGGMVLLAVDDLRRSNLDGLRRLAAWLGVSVDAGMTSDGAQRHQLVAAILSAQKRLAKGPMSKRWDR
jgi:hypothetical protein